MKFFKKLMNMENGIFQGVGQYNIPVIKGMTPDEFDRNAVFVQFHKAVTIKQNRKKYSVHFFVDDYQFERCWTSVKKYADMLLQFDYVMSPDFSMYYDMPLAMQIWNHYRNHYLGAWWQRYGVKVIPTAEWCAPNSYDFCFDGMPKESVIAVESLGTQGDEVSKRMFQSGFREMQKRLHPSLILLYGILPKWLEGEDNVLVIPPFYKEAKGRCVMQAKIKKAMKGGKK